MSDKKKNINEGYTPSKKGYQPKETDPRDVKGGYQPEKSVGTNPTAPPKKK